jgi:PAS domain S-box-containing protein
MGAPVDNALAVQVFLTFFGVMLLALAAGVAESRSSAATLRRNDERFQHVLRATNDVIYDWDIAGDDLWWNQNGDAYFGEVSGPRSFATWAALLHPEDRDRVTARLQALIHGGGQTCNAEYRLRRADGAYVHVNARGFVIRDDTGKPLRLIGSLMDVSDRKQVEEANQRLAHVSRLAMVGELSASIAHEINQPLGAILSNADAAEILLSKETIPVEELRQIIDDIRHDDMRAGEVIRHMRSLLRRRELAMQPFDLNRAIADVLNFAGADLGRHGVRVDTEFTLLPIVHGDQVHLQQVVLNLILNAVDAMEAVPVSRRRLNIRTARSETGGVEITVSDAGIGISPEAAAHLFDSFYTTKPEGMGLGLSIARSIIEAHRGTIQVEPRAGEGACLKVCLPVQPDKAEAGLRAVAGGGAV